MRRRARTWVGIIVTALFTLGLLLSASNGGFSGQAGPEGTRALRRFLANMNVSAADGELPSSSGGTFVLLLDERDDEEAGALLRWVSSGGTLVIADPESSTAAQLGVIRAPGTSASGVRTLSPDCVAPPAVAASHIVVDGSDAGLVAHHPDAVACFPVRSGSFLVMMRHGTGTVAVLAGSSPFRNRLLREGDDAGLVLALMRPPVIFGPAVPTGSEREPRGLWQTLPNAAKVVLLQGLGAALLFAAARARRFGLAPGKDLPSPIRASALVETTGKLYRSAGATGFAGELLRAGAAEELRKRFGVPAGTPRSELAVVVGRAAGLRPADLHEALSGREPHDDRELITLACDLDRLTRRAEGAEGEARR